MAGKNPGTKPLLIGSHIDTVINAGKYDGPLGVISGLAALEQLQAEGVELNYPVHVLGFSDEEGVRFQSTYLGSAGVVGGLDAGLLSARDDTGETLGAVLEKEGWHDGAEDFFYGENDASGYLELHIEQGRVLEEADEAVAVVSGIYGQARLRISVEGLADHAGTTPMDLRRDALAGAAECVLLAEKTAQSNKDLVATVGMMKVSPGASNAIPQFAEFTLDMRYPDDAFLGEALDGLRNDFEDICARRDLKLKWMPVQVSKSVACDEKMISELLDCVEKVSGKRRLLGSGAGHDGVMMSRVMPVGMIFVRCRAGLSHHPEEYAEPDDIALGIEVMVEFLKRRMV
jgi:allantoate deiminase